MLEIFQLQQYVGLMAAYAFPLRKGARQGAREGREELMAQVAEGDRERFASLLNTLVAMSREARRQNSAS
jgi:hypothetical protein